MPIIESLLDNDFYQFTMGQVVHDHFPGVKVAYAGINRDITMELADNLDVDELREEVAAVEALVFHPAELDFLRETGLFSERYLEYLLRDFRLPPAEIETVDGKLSIRVCGPWADAILWETPMLAIVQELFARTTTERAGRDPREVAREGLRRLQAKIDLLNDHPDVQFLEFGSRRRHSAAWQREVVRTFTEQLRFGQLIGTSNVKLAFDLGLPTSGTMAHQLFMVASALEVARGSENPLAVAQNRVLDAWERQYADRSDGRMLIALTDTYGTPFFLEHFTCERAKRWTGFRQDSGNPRAEGEQFLAFYRRTGIDPAEKLLLPSDGLTVDAMVDLSKRFHPVIPTRFGWGTEATNDLGTPVINMVMKPVEADGHPVVKLSNTLGKATGDPDAINRYLELSDYWAHETVRH